MEIVLKGTLTGLVLSLFIGATFFMLIETSMTRGFRAALWFDVGVITSDVVILWAVYFFTSWISQKILQSEYFTIAGGIVFVGFGIHYLLARRKEDFACPVKISVTRLFMNGFIINLLNPSVLVFWMGSMALALSHFGMNGRQAMIYFATSLGVVVVTDIAKAYFSYRISTFLNRRILRALYVISGILMIGLGVLIIFK